MNFHVRRAPMHEQDDRGRLIRVRLDRPVVLLGLLGSGKSRLGRMLARALDVAFYDCDSELEQSAGRSVSEIYDQIGADAFQQAENRILKRLLGADGVSVIATGGGAAMPPDLLDQVLARAVTIWVRADLELMINRTSRGNARPQLKGHDSRVVLQKMIDTYHPIYGRAHVVVDSHDGPAAEVLQQTLNALQSSLDKVPPLS